MIKVNCIVKKHEDRFELELSFDSSESKVEYVQAMAEFLKKKVYEECGTASRYREHTAERGGVLSYTVRMDFRSRRDIANALKADVGRWSKYTVEFERTAREHTGEDEILLIEPQKPLPFRSRKTTAVLWGIAAVIFGFFNDTLIDAFGLVGLLGYIVAVSAVMELIEFVFSRPGGIFVKEISE